MPPPHPALIRSLDDVEWESWPPEFVKQRGSVSWKALVGGEAGAGTNMVVGVARLRTGETLQPHRHTETETYFTLSGEGLVRVDEQLIAVRPGVSIFIPGDALHSIQNPHPADLMILYSFAIDSWDKVVYRS